MQTKPVFEEHARRNQNPNLMFGSCNTFQCKDAPAAFNVSAIPNFIAFLDGKEFKNLKGANQEELDSVVKEVAS